MRRLTASCHPALVYDGVRASVLDEWSDVYRASRDESIGRLETDIWRGARRVTRGVFGLLRNASDEKTPVETGVGPTLNGGDGNLSG